MPKPEHVSGFVRLVAAGRDSKDGGGVPASLRGAESGSRKYTRDGEDIIRDRIPQAEIFATVKIERLTRIPTKAIYYGRAFYIRRQK